MWIIGDGYFRKKLESFETKDVTFYGHVSNEKKYDLLSRAHVILVPAVGEGWGLIVTIPSVFPNIVEVHLNSQRNLAGIKLQICLKRFSTIIRMKLKQI